MSGFLASLAARSTGRERVLEPRRLLFEPREEPPLDAGTRASPGIEPAAEPRQPVAPPSARRERARRRPTAPATDPPRAERDAPDEDRRPAAAPAASVPDRRPPRVAGRVHLREELTSRPDKRPEPRQAHLAPQVRPRAPSDAAPVSPAAARPVRAELAERGPATRRHVLRPPPAAASGSPAGPDVVKITIGRVDVRAVQAAEEKAPPPRAPTPPRMTLEEYLARGQRR